MFCDDSWPFFRPLWLFIVSIHLWNERDIFIKFILNLCQFSFLPFLIFSKPLLHPYLFINDRLVDLGLKGILENWILLMFTLTADPIWLKPHLPLLHPSYYILQRFLLEWLCIPDLKMLQLLFLCLFSLVFNLRLYPSLVLFSLQIVFGNPLF